MLEVLVCRCILSIFILIFGLTYLFADSNTIELRNDHIGDEYFTIRLQPTFQEDTKQFYLQSRKPDSWSRQDSLTQGITIPLVPAWTIEVEFEKADSRTQKTGMPVFEIRDIPEDMSLNPEYFTAACTRETDGCHLSRTFGDHQKDWDYLISKRHQILSEAGLTLKSSDWDKVMALARFCYLNRKKELPPEGGRYYVHPVDFCHHTAYCIGAANTLQAFCSTMQIPARTVGWYNHTACEVYLDGKWRFAENTPKRLESIPDGFDKGPLFRFNLTELMANPGKYGFLYIDGDAYYGLGHDGCMSYEKEKKGRILYNLSGYNNWIFFDWWRDVPRPININVGSVQDLILLYPESPLYYKGRRLSIKLTPFPNSINTKITKIVGQGHGIRQDFIVTNPQNIKKIRSCLLLHADDTHAMPADGGEWYYRINGKKYYLRDHGGWTIKQNYYPDTFSGKYTWDYLEFEIPIDILKIEK